MSLSARLLFSRAGCSFIEVDTSVTADSIWPFIYLLKLRDWCSNGVLLASSFHSALFSLITALVIYSARPLVRAPMRRRESRIRDGHAVSLEQGFCKIFDRSP